MSRILILFPSTGNAMKHELLSLSRAFGESDDCVFLLPSHFGEITTIKSPVISFPGSTKKLKYLFLQFISFFNISLWNQIRVRRFDALHIYNSEGYVVSLVFALWAKILNMRIIVTVHDPTPHPGNFFDRINSWLRPIAIGLADVIHVNSDCFRGGYAQQEALGKIVVHIPLGSVHEVFKDPTPSSEGPSFDVLLLGRIEVYKGIKFLIAAHVESGFKYKMKIVGSGPYSDEVKRSIHGLPGIDFVNRFVSDDEVAGLLDSCKVVVLPYIQATQSSLPLLAAYWRRGLVCSALGGLVEDCIDTQGVLVEPGNVPSLLAGIAQAIRAPAVLPAHRTYRATAQKFKKLYAGLDLSCEGCI